MPRKAIGKVRSIDFHASRLKAASLIAAGVTVCKALRESGYAASTSRVQPKSVIGPIREIVAAEMDRQGLTIPAIVERLHARTHSLTLKNVKDENGDDITVEVEDNAAQLEAIKIAANFRGLNQASKVEVAGSIQVEVTADDILAARKEAEGKVTNGPGSNGNSSRLHGV